MHGLDQLADLLARRDWAKAAKVLERAIASGMRHPSLFYNLGKVHQETGRYDDAKEQFRRAVKLSSAHTNAWFELGRSAVETHDLEVALDAFGKARALDVKDRDTMRNLGRVALRLGEYDIARDAWTPLAGEDEADAALYRIAAETRSDEAEERRDWLLANTRNRAGAIQTLVRVSKGKVPLNLR